MRKDLIYGAFLRLKIWGGANSPKWKVFDRNVCRKALLSPSSPPDLAATLKIVQSVLMEDNYMSCDSGPTNFFNSLSDENCLLYCKSENEASAQRWSELYDKRTTSSSFKVFSIGCWCASRVILHLLRKLISMSSTVPYITSIWQKKLVYGVLIRQHVFCQQQDVSPHLIAGLFVSWGWPPDFKVWLLVSEKTNYFS